MSRFDKAVVTGLLILVGSGGAVRAEGQGWQLTFKAVSGTFVVKEPIWARVTLTNVSTGELPRAEFWGHFYLDNQEQPCRSDLAPVSQMLPSPPTTPTLASPVPRQLEQAGWEQSMEVNLGDLCNLVRRGEAVIGGHTVCYRDDASPGMLSPSACVSFVIEAPQGIDKEAYEAFGHDPLGDSERYGELLRRFPTSTYAAYVVWEFAAKGLASMPVTRTTDYLNINVARLGNSVPDQVSTWRSYSGEAFIRWREGWFSQILTAHPAIWFGDELRFTSALDVYFLGDKSGCAAQLRDLAEHARPYVATKAGELLAAMQAKGMLEEKAK